MVAGSDTTCVLALLTFIPATLSAWQFPSANSIGRVYLLTARQKLHHFAIAHRLVLSGSSYLFPPATL